MTASTTRSVAVALSADGLDAGFASVDSPRAEERSGVAGFRARAI